MSFWELLVVMFVGLFVVGPERLPGAIRSGMLWFGRLKRGINDTRAEFEQQLGMDEIRRELHNEQIMESLRALEKSQSELAAEINTIDASIKDEVKRIEKSADDPIDPHHHTSGQHSHTDEAHSTLHQSEQAPAAGSVKSTEKH